MTLAPIISAIIMVETGGHPSPASAVGDNGKAVGILQIHPEVVRDCNRAWGCTRWTLADRSHPGKAREMAAEYLTIYGISRGITDPVQLARIWNGGPRGHLRKSTLAYGRKFAEAFKKQGELRRVACGVRETERVSVHDGRSCYTRRSNSQAGTSTEPETKGQAVT